MEPVDWQQNVRIPRGVRAALTALQWGRAADGLTALAGPDWEQALAFCDRSQLTLVLGNRCSGFLPHPVRKRIDRDTAANAVRLERAKQAYCEAAAALEAAGVEFVVLKGLSQWPEFVSDLRLRPQYDLDLYCPGESVYAARDALLKLGYEPHRQSGRLPLDHLPAMIRKTGWQWRGDFFDPEIPFSIDLHYRLWDECTERLPAAGLDGFWTRRVRKRVDGVVLPALAPADAVAYACMHLLRHLLRGSVRVYHVYELSHFLNAGVDGADIPIFNAVCFRLAAAWFGCELPAGCVLPQRIELWFEQYAASPVEALFRPNKDEIWLHLALLGNARDKAAVLWRRLVPTSLPGPVDAVHTPEREMTWRLRVGSRAKYLRYVTARAVLHARAAPRMLGHVLGQPYWTFLGSAILYELGVFIFVLLYNLYLLDQGHSEKTLGAVASATAVGSIAGTLPAGALVARLGLRRTLVLCFLGVAVLSALRSMVATRPLLVGLAFAGGVFASIWPVSVAPAIARLTSEGRRPLGFSLFFGSGIALGIVAGFAGGRFPGLFGSKRIALLAACGVTALAAIPASRIAFGQASPGVRRSYPRGCFVLQFLGAIAVWNIATGLFNPFFNAYFARHLEVPVAQIGAVFSWAQLAQVAAMLAAPLVFRRMGLAAGIAVMQAATALALIGLAAAGSATTAVLAYAAYTAFQYMSEPGIFSLLMDRVQPNQQSGASALQFFVTASAQAVAAAAAGIGLAHFGYPPVLAAAAGIALASALLFRVLKGAAPEPRPDSAPAIPS